MKKLLCMLLALTVVLVAFAGIASAEEAANWKIAIMTGTTSQGEEEFRAAEALKEKYPDNVITDTYRPVHGRAGDHHRQADGVRRRP